MIQKFIKLRYILSIFTSFIIFYLIFSLGWGPKINTSIHSTILFGLIITLIILNGTYLLKKHLEKRYKSIFFLSFIVLVCSFIFCIINYLIQKNNELMEISLLVSLTIYILIIITYLIRNIYLKIHNHNPVIIFITSFILLSLIGTFLLLLPNCTVKKISFIDALFTSTSAVCVTGLSVLDISKDFTYLGQWIILILIEIGGLGILTITSCLSYFFRDGFSFREGNYISNFLNTKKKNNVLSLAAQVVFFTLIIESIGAILIFLSIRKQHVSDNPLFFAIFHSISAFCNGGFSILNQGLYSIAVRYHYVLQIIIASLIILGGIGFNSSFNLFTYIWLTMKKFFYKTFKNQHIKNPAHILTLNTKIVILSTIFLIIFGTIFYFAFEFNHSLLEHESYTGKLISSFFSSVTSRTAGFQVINMHRCTTITILITILLMWIGASPGSTGGGIKTSTFVLALMNIISLSTGKTRLEIQKNEISYECIQCSFAIIIFSFITTYLSILIILFLDPKKNLLYIIFEVVSAFSTVGLSLGITPSLSYGSKLVLIILMLLGRIGCLNIMFGFFKKNKIISHDYYRYPNGYILIN
ncbi:TrkH family potassium uptake protein [Blattabacterium cuenoti]|uniref:TrkH family potassium uptake protein n=1 Tax=Blattabacterium cuenoti TaxID=1653831 RepID=UPI00163CDC66|nr:potassium transporter TrkG [Blattabacterium cuenoti]